MSAKEVLKLRQKLEITQEELANALGLHGKEVICRWETGTREPNEALQRLFRYLNEATRAEAERIIKRFSEYGTRKRN